MNFFVDWFYELSAGDTLALFTLLLVMILISVRNGLGNIFKKKRKRRKKSTNTSDGGDSSVDADDVDNLSDDASKETIQSNPSSEDRDKIKVPEEL